MGESVEISRLAAVLEMDKQEVTALLKEMDKDYRKENRGIFLMWLEDSVQLSTKADLYEYLIKIAKTPRKMVLTDTVIETLSIIAYKQPVTRLEIEKIRGVSCDHAINKLLEYELITELGRKDAPGRPLLFGTTEQFLRCFGVKSGYLSSSSCVVINATSRPRWMLFFSSGNFQRSSSDVAQTASTMSRTVSCRNSSVRWSAVITRSQSHWST